MGSVFSSARFAANTVNEAALRRRNFSAIEFQRQFIGASEICISLNAITAPAHLHSSSLLLAHVYSDNKWKLLPMSMREQRQMRVINIRPYIHHAQHERSLPPGPESSFYAGPEGWMTWKTIMLMKRRKRSTRVSNYHKIIMMSSSEEL